MTEQSRSQSPALCKIILYIVLVLLYLPVFVMIVDSFLLNGHFSFVWYEKIIVNHELFGALQRSVYVGFVASMIATVLGTFASLVIARSHGQLSRALSAFSYFSLIVPELVFALALLSWFYVLKIPLSLSTVIIAHITFSISFVIMTVNGPAISLDREIEDAGRDLGATEWVVLRKITLPLLVPAIASGFLLAFLLSFDDFLISFYNSGVGSDTLPIRLYAAMRAGLTPTLSALATIMLAISTALILILIQFRELHAAKNRQP